MNVSTQSSVGISASLTAVDKVVDLVYTHAGALGCAHCSLLLLAPVVYVERVLGVAGTRGQ